MFNTPRTHRLAIILALTFPLAARAHQGSLRAKAQEMMTLLQTQRMVTQNSDNIAKQVTDAADTIAGANPSPDTKAKAADFKKQATQKIDSQLSWDSMRAGITDIYVKNFTEEELDSIISFYKSPAGLALLTKMPVVNSEVTQFGTSRITALQPPMKQLFDAFRGSQATETPAVSPPLAPTPAAPTPAAPTAPATSAPKPSTPK